MISYVLFGESKGIQFKSGQKRLAHQPSPFSLNAKNTFPTTKTLFKLVKKKIDLMYGTYAYTEQIFKKFFVRNELFVNLLVIDGDDVDSKYKFSE